MVGQVGIRRWSPCPRPLPAMMTSVDSSPTFLRMSMPLFEEVGGGTPPWDSPSALEHVHEALEGEGGVLLALEQEGCGSRTHAAGGRQAPPCSPGPTRGIVVAVGGDVHDVLHRWGYHFPPQLLAGAAPAGTSSLMECQALAPCSCRPG